MDWNAIHVTEQFYMDIPDEVVQNHADEIAKYLNKDLVDRIISQAEYFGGQESCVKIGEPSPLMGIT